MWWVELQLVLIQCLRTLSETILYWRRFTNLERMLNVKARTFNIYFNLAEWKIWFFHVRDEQIDNNEVNRLIIFKEASLSWEYPSVVYVIVHGFDFAQFSSQFGSYGDLMKHLTYKYWRKHFIISPTSSLLRINTHHPQRRQLISFKTIAGNGSLRHTDLKNSNKQEKVVLQTWQL